MSPVRLVRVVLAIVVAVFPAAAIALVAVALAPRLGATVASHWSGPGPADGFASTWGTFWAFAAITAALAIGAIVAAVFAARQEVSRTLPAVVVVIAGFTACAWIVTAWATAAAATPADARLEARMLILLPAAASGAVVYLLLPPTAPPLSGEAARPSLPLEAHERISWTGQTGSRLLEGVTAVMALIFVGTIVLAIVIRVPSVWVPVAVIGLATLGCLALAPARLTVDRRGIRLTSALLRVPLIRVRLENIESVTTDTIEPAQWGGWGYRISGAGLAYVARRGPGLVVDRHGGNAVAITVDQPEKPAAVANALIKQLAEHGANPR